MSKLNHLIVLVASSIVTAAGAGHTHSLWTTDASAYRSYEVLPRSNGYSARSEDLPPLRFTDDYLVESLKSLTGVRDPVLANRGSAAGRAAAREFMRKEFETLGFRVSEHAYGSGTNLIAERAGKSGKFLIVSAHYDSVNNAGADDDGTGVIAMLGTARLLRNANLKHGVRFVAFDQEELGLVGSAAYVKNLVAKGEKPIILGDLQMEMMGYNARKDGKFHVISCKRKDSEFLVDAFVSAVRNAANGLVISTACTDRSDHDSFWKNGIPAIVISENFFGGDSNPCYHAKCDTIDKMHTDYFTKVAEVAASAVRAIVAE